MSSSTAERVATEVRVEMARQRKSGRELAQLLNLSPGSISHRMTGRQEFTLSELTDIADWLGVSVTSFFRVAA